MAIDQALFQKLSAIHREKGLKWVLAQTSMLDLTADQRRMRLGYVPGPDQLALEGLTEPDTLDVPEPPPVWDWRNVQSRNFISRVKDQGHCGSCVAFAVAAIVEAGMRISTDTALGDPDGASIGDLSEAQLFYCGAGSQGRTCSTGWWISDGLQYVQDTGVVPDSCYPYSAGDQACELPQTAADEATTITGQKSTLATQQMKAWISASGPLAAAFDVYEDFFAYGGGVYIYDGVSAQEGAHAVCVIGYDDGKQAWLCKNSWGTGWGMGGYFLIGYGQCGIDKAMWGISDFTSIYRGQYQIGGNTTNSAPCVSDDRAWFRGDDNVLWVVDSDGSNQSQPGNNQTLSSPVVANGLVYFQGTDNTLWQMNTDGTGLVSVGGNTTISAPFVAADGSVWFRGEDNALKVVQPDGTQSQPGGNKTLATPFVANGYVYFQGTDNTLWQMKTDGSAQVSIGSNTTISAPFVASDGSVWFRGEDNVLWVVQPDGTQSQPGGNETLASPIVVNDWVYFQGTDSTLWRMKTDGSAQVSIGGNTTCNPDPFSSDSPAPFFVSGDWIYFRGTDGRLIACPTDATC